MDVPLLALSLRPRRAWVLAAPALLLIGCPPSDDYYVNDAQTPAPTSGPSSPTPSSTATDTPPPPPPAVCGNGIAEGAEGCDGQDLRGGSCEVLGLSEGTLRCTDACRFDLSGCNVSAPVCGDGVADAAEGCDGLDLRGESCQRLGLTSGQLACTAACRFETSGCSVIAPVCGDGAAQDAELCDGLDLRGQSCEGLGLGAGALRCTTSCTPDLTGCTAHVPACGDGVGEAGESCDGTDLRGQDCESIGFLPGTLACDDDCGFDTSECGESVSGCEDQGAGGASDECCEPLAEVCDGQSNDCDDMVDEGDACPEGCTAKTFQGHLYLLCVHGTASLQKDYGDAVAECAGAQVALGLGVRMELARVESAPENDFIKTWIRGTTSSEGMVWFGANDIAQETRWVWGQGTTATLFFEGNNRGGGRAYQGAFHDFPMGRPNSANGTDEDCGALDSESDWRWNDLLCTGSRLGFLCEQVDDGGAGSGGGGSGGGGSGGVSGSGGNVDAGGRMGTGNRRGS